MIKIYHNPRCSKSREGLEILENSGEKFEVIKYLDTVPDETELKEVLKCLGMAPIDLVRKNEKIWKEEYKGKSMSDEEIIRAMIEHPRLIERPIVVKNAKAVIGRPPENIKNIL
ncbi:arsenate reductase (glutaredoxin) [Robertkochia flava]|uniref:arsenate reductase (glutaredoxin) n=1 Tax=Robertkochia flava TaxID=3447986 RepID=UPI001CCE0629|nr:arsenate reductase (glutaredoxin) [Robertkochia marina]